MKERELREQMERELRSKEQQLNDVTKRQSDLEMKLLKLNLNESETKSENDRLQKVKEENGRKVRRYSFFRYVGKESIGRTITRNNSKFRRIEELYRSITKSDEKRETRSSKVEQISFSTFQNFEFVGFFFLFLF